VHHNRRTIFIEVRVTGRECSTTPLSTTPESVYLMGERSQNFLVNYEDLCLETALFGDCNGEQKHTEGMLH